MFETKRVSVLEIFMILFLLPTFTLLYMLADITKYPLETNLIWRFALTLSVILYVWFSQAAYNNRYLKGPGLCLSISSTKLSSSSSLKAIRLLGRRKLGHLGRYNGFLSLSLFRYGLQWFKAQDDQNKYFAASHALIFLAQGVLLLLGTKLSYEWGVAGLVVAILAGLVSAILLLRDRQVPQPRTSTYFALDHDVLSRLGCPQLGYLPISGDDHLTRSYPRCLPRSPL